MNDIKDAMKRNKFSYILPYMLYATGENETMIESYDNSINESYEIFFDDIESLYADADRENDKLFDIISEFACVHNDVYFNVGTIIGLQLYKELTQKFECHSDKDIAAILERRKLLLDTDHEISSALQSLCTHRLNTALKEDLSKDKIYQNTQEEINEAIMSIDKIGLTPSQLETVDRALATCNTRKCEYGKKAYLQGFEDAVNIII